MKRPDTITMLDSVGEPNIKTAVPALLKLLAPRIEALRQARPVLQVATVAEPREQVQNPAA